jgi:cytochrome c peroxidase
MKTMFVCSVGCALTLVAACDDGPGRQDTVALPSGVSETEFTHGKDPGNLFFKSVGTNQRTCETCHDSESGWSITPSSLQNQFEATSGTGPIFRTVDGANSPLADVSTLQARRIAYSLLLDRGLLRVGQKIPANAEFTVSAIDDPNNFASEAELSLFRRPLPSTNLRFVAQIMWDGREPTLDKQAGDATRGHAQAMAVDDGDMKRIVDFESSLFNAQRFDDIAGDLASDGAAGGAATLVTTDFRVGINDSKAATFERYVFTLYGAWNNTDTSTDQGKQRAAIARGEEVFNSKVFRISGVAGLDDQDGTCSTCHNTPNVGGRSTTELLDIGVSNQRRRFDGLPLYTLTHKQTGRTVRTTDPGAALVTGHWNDINKFKVPNLRGLASRPPYFHNGSGTDLDDVIRFYQQRFDVGLSDRDEEDLKAFLAAL